MFEQDILFFSRSYPCQIADCHKAENNNNNNAKTLQKEFQYQTILQSQIAYGVGAMMFAFFVCLLLGVTLALNIRCRIVSFHIVVSLIWCCCEATRCYSKLLKIVVPLLQPSSTHRTSCMIIFCCFCFLFQKRSSLLLVYLVSFCCFCLIFVKFL